MRFPLYDLNPHKIVALESPAHSGNNSPCLCFPGSPSQPCVSRPKTRALLCKCHLILEKYRAECKTNPEAPSVDGSSRAEKVTCKENKPPLSSPWWTWCCPPPLALLLWSQPSLLPLTGFHLRGCESVTRNNNNNLKKNNATRPFPVRPQHISGNGIESFSTFL